MTRAEFEFPVGCRVKYTDDDGTYTGIVDSREIQIPVTWDYGRPFPQSREDPTVLTRIDSPEIAAAAPTLPEGMTAETLRTMARWLDGVGGFGEMAVTLRRWADELEASPPPAPTAPEGQELVALPREVVDQVVTAGWASSIGKVLAAACRATRDARPLSDSPTPETERVPWTEALGRVLVADGLRIEEVGDSLNEANPWVQTNCMYAAADGTVEVLKDLS